MKLYGFTTLRQAALILMLLSVLLPGTGRALAAAPSNDNIADAIMISGVPFSDTRDTSEATTASDDPNCAGQGATIWYTFTPSADIQIAANTFGSSYDTTLSVYTGVPGALSQLACNDDSGSLQSRVVFDAVASQTYYLMVGSYASGPGGTLVFSLDVAPPPLEIDLRLDRFGSFSPKSRTATVQGTVICSRPTTVTISGQIAQKAGRAIISGSFGTTVECAGQANWSAVVVGNNGRFAGGPVQVSAFAFAYDPLTNEYAFDDVSGSMKLRGSN